MCTPPIQPNGPNIAFVWQPDLSLKLMADCGAGISLHKMCRASATADNDGERSQQCASAALRIMPGETLHGPGWPEHPQSAAADTSVNSCQ